MVTTSSKYHKHPTQNALVFEESWGNEPASLADMILAAYAEFPGKTPEETRETVGFLHPAVTGVEADELLVGPIPTGSFINHDDGGSMTLTPVVSLADAMRAARTSPFRREYNNVFFLWERDSLVMVVRKAV